MSSPNEPSRAQANAQILQPDRELQTEHDKPCTAGKDHKTQIDSLKNLLNENQQSIIFNVEHSLKRSALHKLQAENKLREEEQRVANLTKKLSTQQLEHKDELDEMKIELASQKINHGLTKLNLTKAKSDLEEANERLESLQERLKAEEGHKRDLQRKCAGAEHSEYRLRELSITLDEVKKSKMQLEAELKLIEREPADLRKHLKSVEQQNVDLKANLQATTKRASAAEIALKDLKSRFKQIKDDMTALASSSEQQPIMIQPVPSALTEDHQGSVVDEESRSRNKNSPAQTQSLDLIVSKSTGNKEPDLLHCQSVLDEVMDMKNWQHNQYFLKTVSSLTLISRDAKIGPINLGSIKEKLDNKAYTSGASFKADFDTMIADCKRLNNPQNVVCIAADQLSKIFEQAFSAQPNSSHQCLDFTNSTQETSNRKRKAETDTGAFAEGGHVQKRCSLAPLDQDTDHGQPASPGTGGGPTTDLISSNQSKGNFHAQKQTDECCVKVRITTAPAFEFDANLSTVAQLVSIIRSPRTIHGDWQSMIPDKQVFAYAAQTPVGDRISELVRGLSSDVIILRLMPAAKADKPDFDLIYKHFIAKRRFGIVSHVGIKNVEDIYLIPVSREHSYPDFFPTLDPHLLPPSKTEDVLLMAIIFKVPKNKQTQVRNAWDLQMMAIQNHDNNGLASMHNILRRNPLHIFSGRRTIVSNADRHLAMLRDLPRSSKIPGPEIQAYGHDILLLSCREWGLSSRPKVDGVGAPRWVFVLGIVVLNDSPKSVLVVDIQEKNRPLWLVGQGASDRMGFTLTLLANKFPGSLKEWEDTIPEKGGIPNREGEKCIKNVGLQLKRCKCPE